jgi:hypothetical protein
MATEPARDGRHDKWYDAGQSGQVSDNAGSPSLADGRSGPLPPAEAGE